MLFYDLRQPKLAHGDERFSRFVQLRRNLQEEKLGQDENEGEQGMRGCTSSMSIQTPE